MQPRNLEGTGLDFLESITVKGQMIGAGQPRQQVFRMVLTSMSSQLSALDTDATLALGSSRCRL